MFNSTVWHSSSYLTIYISNIKLCIPFNQVLSIHFILNTLGQLTSILFWSQQQESWAKGVGTHIKREIIIVANNEKEKTAYIGGGRRGNENEKKMMENERGSRKSILCWFEYAEGHTKRERRLNEQRMNMRWRGKGKGKGKVDKKRWWRRKPKEDNSMLIWGWYYLY